MWIWEAQEQLLELTLAEEIWHELHGVCSETGEVLVCIRLVCT